MPDSLPTEIPGSGANKDKIIEVAEATLAASSPPEIQPFNISFINYKEDKCGVNGIDGRNAQAAIKIVKNIGLDFRGHSLFATKHGGPKMEIKRVSNSAPYDDYYKRLPSEISDFEEVKEIKYVDARVGKQVDLRIFYYALSNIFYMLAITASSHENLDHKPIQYKSNHKKQRRY